MAIYIEAATEEEAERKINEVLKEYPTAGWSTTIDKPALENGKWVARGWRGTHCD